jgi:hypothetical protein
VVGGVYLGGIRRDCRLEAEGVLSAYWRLGNACIPMLGYCDNADWFGR